MRLLSVCVIVFALAGCGSPSPSEPPPDQTAGEEDETSERASMTAEECTAQGGDVVGDIGDGAVHRPDYLCPSGEPPIGTVPLGIEGSVCCPSAAE
jgi:predicted small lipoprotein YifL